VPKADQVQCSKKSLLILAAVLKCQQSGLFQTRFERGKKASCFASSDGAMIKGERYRQHAVDDLLIIVDDHAPLSAASADDGYLGRNDHKAGKAAADHPKIRKGYRSAAQFFWRN
jgi:hypothetical protein